MSGEFWRPLDTIVRFNFCDICGTEEGVNILESKEEEGIILVRFLCEDCHTTKRVVVDSVRQVGEKDVQTIEESWIRDFIEEQKKTGSIDTIGVIPHEQNNLSVSEAPEEVLAYDNVEEEISEEVEIITAPWSAGFVQEALFGSDPLGWLRNQGAFSSEKIQETVDTLIYLSHNQAGAVQLSSIQCLGEAIDNSTAEQKQKIHDTLNALLEEADDISRQIINSVIRKI